MNLDMSNAMPKWVRENEGHLWLAMVFFMALWVAPGVVIPLLWIAGFSLALLKVVDFTGGKRARSMDY